MKKSMIGLSILAVGLLSACQKDDVTTTEKGGNAGKAYASLTVKMNKPLSRALTDQQADEVATSEESKIDHIDFISPSGNRYFSTLGTSGQELTADPDGVTYRTEPFQVNYPAGGQMEAAVTANLATDKYGVTPSNLLYLGHLPTQTDIDTQDDASEIRYFARRTDDSDQSGAIFAMSSALRKITLQRDKTAKQVKDGTGENDNKFSFDLERVVCKGYVEKGAALESETADKRGKIELDNAGGKGLTFTAVNGATKTYVFARGERDLTDDGHGVWKYKNYASVIDNLPIGEQFGDAETAYKSGLIRLGFLGAQETYKVQDVDEPNSVAFGTTEGAHKGIYFYENSCKEFKGQAEDYGFYRLASAKIYATYTPNKYYHVTITGQKPNIKFELSVWDSDTDKNGVPNKGVKVGEPSAQKDITGTFLYSPKFVTAFDTRLAALVFLAKQGVTEADTKVTALLKAANDGTLDGTDEAVGKEVLKFFKAQYADDSHNKLLDVYTYGNGRCGYYALWNAQKSADGSTVAYGDTRRNNVYALTINKFMTIGFPWDSSDPNDPNLPKSGDDPKPGTENPHVNKAKTFMDVTCKVLNWNVVQRAVDLGN